VSFISFQRINDFYKFEIGDTETAWVLSTVTADVGANESTDIVWAASASIAVPAAIVLAALATL